MLSPKAPAGHASTVFPPNTHAPLVLACMMFLVPALGVPNEFVLQDTLKSALVALMVLSAVLLYLWQTRATRDAAHWHHITFIPLGLMLYALASMSWAHSYLAAVEAIRWFLLTIVVWLGSQCLRSSTARLTLAFGIHAGATVAALWACSQFWLGLELFPQAAAPASTFINRNFFAEYAVAALPFSWLVLASCRSTKWVVAISVSVAVEIVALMMTGTRSALIALLVATPAVLYLFAKYRHELPWSQWPANRQRWALALVMVATLGLGSISSANPSVIREATGTTALERSLKRVGSVLKTSEYVSGSFSLRAEMWMATARMIYAHPWTGVGAGSWEVQVPLHQNRDTSSELDFFAHNEALQLLAEYGLPVGGLSLTFLLAYLLMSARPTQPEAGGELQEGPIRSVALCSLLSLLIVSNAGFPLHLAATCALMALCLALLAGSDIRLGRPGYFKSLRLPALGHHLALVGFAGCLIAALGTSVQAARAESTIVITAKQMLQYITGRQAQARPANADVEAIILANARQSVSLNPHYRKLLNSLGNLFAIQGQWAPAIEVWEAIVSSRPNIPDIWANLVQGQSQLGNRKAASAALKRLNELQPDSLRTLRLEILLLSRSGHELEAAVKLREHFQSANPDLNLVQAGYSLGLEMKNEKLAIEALELQVRLWPAFAADACERLGDLYAKGAGSNIDPYATQAYARAWQETPPSQRQALYQRLPQGYRQLAFTRQ